MQPPTPGVEKTLSMKVQKVTKKGTRKAKLMKVEKTTTMTRDRSDEQEERGEDLVTRMKLVKRNGNFRDYIFYIDDEEIPKGWKPIKTMC